MKKLTLTLLLSLFSSFMCHAQQSITGHVFYAADNTPAEYANVVVLQKDSTYITGTVCDAHGSFTLPLPSGAPHPALIQVTSLGYKKVVRQIEAYNIGTLLLEDDAQMLNEVIVKADLPVTRIKGDALVTNVEGTTLAKAGTAENLLDYIPGVTSQNGELIVLGRGTPVVYINGRLMRDESELDQLSSDNIKSVEVISNPGARYDASVKAVIRIQTKKALGDGFSVSDRMYTAYNKYWDVLNQLDLNYRLGGLDVFGMLYLYQGNWWDGFTIVQDTYLDNHWKQVMGGRNRGKNKNLTTNLGMNYVFNPEHSMGFKYQFGRSPQNDTDATYDAAIYRDDLSFEETKSRSRTMGDSHRHSLNLYYNGTVKDWGIDFNTDFLWADANNDSESDETMKPAGEEEIRQTVTTFTEASNRLYASKLVLSHSLLGGTFEFGGEYSHTNRHTDYLNPQGILQNDASEIKEDNVAAFAEFRREFGKIQLQAGLRYEHVTFDYYQEKKHVDEQSKKYDDFFPSISLATSFGRLHMQLGYSQDISRPSFNSLRSHVYYVNHYTYESGNPFLLPTITHNISLSSTYRFWQFYVACQHLKDDVMFTSEPYSDSDPNVTLIKPINAKSYDVAYARLTAAPVIAWWSPRFTVAVQKQWFDAEKETGSIQLHRPMLSFRWQNAFKLPAGFLFNLNAGWTSKYDNGNTRSERNSFVMDASLNKSFMKDRLSLQLNGYDVFLTKRRFLVQHASRIYTMSKDVNPSSRIVSLTVRYKFNQAKDKYKGEGAGKSQKSRL